MLPYVVTVCTFYDSGIGKCFYLTMSSMFGYKTLFIYIKYIIFLFQRFMKCLLKSIRSIGYLNSFEYTNY